MKIRFRNTLFFLGASFLSTSCVTTTEVFRDEVRVTREPLPCPKECPEYRLSLYGDGWANFTGYNNVELIGDYEKFIGKNIVDSLIVLFDETAFFTLPKEIHSRGFRGKQEVALSLKMGDYFHKVYYEDRGPAIFRKIDRVLEQVARDQEGWKEVSSEPEEQPKSGE